VEADLKEARRRSGKLSAELTRISQEAAKLQTQAEQAYLKAKDLLANAILEQVEKMHV
jgi:phage shock protein A